MLEFFLGGGGAACCVDAPRAPRRHRPLGPKLTAPIFAFQSPSWKHIENVLIEVSEIRDLIAKRCLP